MLHFVILLCALTLGATGLTSCPERTPQDDFDVSRFSGTWYEVKSVSTPSLEAAKCVHNIANQTADGELYIVGMFYSTETSQYRQFKRDLTRPSGSTSGHFTTGAPGLGSQLIVIGTDYSTYAVLASCWQRNGTYYERLGVGAPAKTLSSEAETIVNQLLPDVNWETTDQNDCPEHSHDH